MIKQLICPESLRAVDCEPLVISTTVRLTDSLVGFGESDRPKEPAKVIIGCDEPRREQFERLRRRTCSVRAHVIDRIIKTFAEEFAPEAIDNAP